MKKHLFFLLLCCIALISCQQEKPNEFTFKGHIENFTDSVRITFYASNGTALEPLFEEMIGEDFSLTVPFDFADQELPALVRVAVSGRGWENRLKDLWIKPGTEVTASFRYGETYSAEFRSKVKEQKWQEKLEEAQREGQERAFRYYQLSMACNRKAINPELTEAERQLLEDSTEIYYKRYLDAGQEEPGLRVAPMRKMPHNKVWWLQMERLAEMVSYFPNVSYAEGARELFMNLSDKEKQSEQGQQLQKMLFPPEPYKIGEVEDAELESMDGETCRLADFRGKYVLLDMWSIGCGACYAAEPMLAEVAEKYADRLTIISINTDDTKTWRKYASLSHITWHNMQDTEGRRGLFQKNECHCWPTFILLSPEGKKIEQFAGVPESMDEYIVMHISESVQ